MRYLFILLLTGCTLQTPFWGPDVAYMCKDGTYTVTHGGKTKTFTVVVNDENLLEKCKTGRACLYGTTAYVPEGRSCPKALAHEMSHVWGYDWVDGV